MKRIIKSLFSFVGYSLLSEKRISELTSRSSYSQYGEDNIILLCLGLHNIKNATYMDIGANDPFRLNNTTLLYQKGFTGINIEPEPRIFQELKEKRPKDVNLNIGVYASAGQMTYYQFDNPVFNTFSEKEARGLEKKNFRLAGTKLINVETYDSIVETNLSGIPPTILFLDAEGLDEAIIDSINFRTYAPTILCVETYAYGIGVKDYRLIEKIENYGYEIFADTFVNTIFLKKP